MTANGTFDVKLTPQGDADFPAGRMLIEKTYAGDMKGLGIGQMISKGTSDGAAVYYAIEEFTGVIGGKSGAFTLLHKGHMDKDAQSLEVSILGGSGAGELEGISGSMRITQDEDGHQYSLAYEL